MSRMLIFGLGYAASRIAAALRERGWAVDATGSAGNLDFDDETAVRAALGQTQYILSSVPPANGADPVIDRFGDTFPNVWLGYLSSTGVYGDAKGAWVDENTPIGSGRRTARAECDQRWLDKGSRVFRLPGIYGPGRSAFDRINSGKANRIAMPGQVFSRVHVDDIVSGVLAGLDAPSGAYNLSDDLPCAQNLVIEEACRLKGVHPPPMQTLEEANLSKMAMGFYSENRRVANGKAKRVLGWEPQYPDYRSGLKSLL